MARQKRKPITFTYRGVRFSGTIDPEPSREGRFGVSVEQIRPSGPVLDVPGLVEDTYYVRSLELYEDTEYPEVTELMLPSTITTLYFETNHMFPKLQKVTIPRGTPYFADGCMIFSKYRKELLYTMNVGRDSVLEIPKGIIRIGPQVFDQSFPTTLQAPFLPDFTDILAKDRAKELMEGLLLSFVLTDPEHCFSLALLRSFTGLKSITVPEGHVRYETVDGVLYDRDRKALLFYPRSRPDPSFTPKEGTLRIAPYAFYGASFLKELRLPDSVVEVGEQSLCFCPALESIWFPDGLDVLPGSPYDGVGVCSNNRSLSFVHLPKKLDYMGHSCFYNTPLKVLALPDHLRFLGGYALGARSLKEISLPASMELLLPGALAFATKVTAYEGTARNLVTAINPKGSEWKSAWITVKKPGRADTRFFYLPSEVSAKGFRLLCSVWDSDTLDYDLYADVFEEVRRMEDKICLSLLITLQGEKSEMSEKSQKSGKLAAYLKRSSLKAGSYLIGLGNLPLFKSFLDLGFLSKASLKKLLEEANAASRSDFAAYLLDYEEQAQTSRLKSLFAL